MTEIHTMRDLEYLEEQNRQLRESLKACKLEVNRLRAALEVTSSDCKEAFAENERLRAALREIASGKYSGLVLPSLPPQDPAVNRARAALEGKND